MSRPRIAVPLPFLDWLEIDGEALRTALNERGMDTWLIPAPPDSPTPEATDAYPQELFAHAVRYMHAVESERYTRETGSKHGRGSHHQQARFAEKYAYYHAQLVKSHATFVLLIQGLEPSNAALRAAALTLGLPLLSLENTAWKRRVVWENNDGMPSIQNFARDFHQRFSGCHSDEEITQFITRYFADARDGKSPEHQTPTRSLPAFDHRPAVLFLGQVFTDSSVIFGRGSWSSPLELMLETARWCIANNHALIIKLHPKEHQGADPILNRPYRKLTWRKMNEHSQLMAALDACSAIVDHENAYSTQGLIDHCRIAVTMSSQAGLEAAMLGKPVIAGGTPYYGGLGFTLDGTTPAALHASLTQAPSWQATTSAMEFALIFFEHYCVERSASGLADLILRLHSNRAHSD